MNAFPLSLCAHAVRAVTHSCGFRLRRWLALAAVLGGAAASLPAANISAPGAGILGLKADTDGTLGGFRFNSGSATNIIDGNLSTRVDNHLVNDARSVSFVGVIWYGKHYEAITGISLTLATFGDGGWFGVPGAPAPTGGALAATNLIEPLVQVTTNRGTTWVTVASTSDYQTVMLGHQIGGTGGQPNPSVKTSTFTFGAPITGVNGIRVLGTNGGRAGADTNGFLGVFDFAVQADSFTDADTDGMPDAWEVENSVTDPADDPDFDGLTNLDEFQQWTNPNQFDTDGDGLADGDEVGTYLTIPFAADSDNDGLTDGAEINTHFTNPLVADTDGDGLGDAAELNIHGTNPLVWDTDGDGWRDGLEISAGTNPNNAGHFPENFALIGTGIIGVKASVDTGADEPFSQQGLGLVGRINDNSVASGNFLATYNGAGTQRASYVGIVWSNVVTVGLQRLDLTMAIFQDGGYFGSNFIDPGPGGVLTSNYLVEPIVQVSTDRGTNWVTVPATSDYWTYLVGKRIGGGGQLNPTNHTISFTLVNAASNINGIRILGQEGGRASGGFIGVAELKTLVAVSDTDNDGMSDSWETTHGLTVGVNDAAGDLDSDGLSNLGEFQRNTDPQVADSDGDGLTDGAEVTIHNTNPAFGDTDSDGLTDGAEVNTHGTNPTKRDTDGDGFGDGFELAQTTDPLNASSFPSNLALSSAVTGLLGTKATIDSLPGTPVFNSGGPGSINDGDPNSRVDTYNGGGTHQFSFVGLNWTSAPPASIVRLELTLATFFDGGWFGPNGTGPGSGNLLSPAYLVEPTVQVSSNGGATWVTVPHASDYLTVMTNHPLPAVDFGPPTSRTSHFLFPNPLTNITSVRIVGREGGQASGGFLGVFELAARNMVYDTDNDGMNDEWEGWYEFVVGTDDSAGDSDGDGLSNLQEFIHNAKPNLADSDGDGLNDGVEVNTYGTSPIRTDSDGDGLTDGAEVNTHFTNPALADTDGDGFPDGMELAQSTDPLIASSHSLNYAFAGTAILGTTPNVNTAGTLVFNAGSAASINDGNLATHVDSYSVAPDTNSFVGIVWPRSFTNITRLEFTMATFFDGGWFGVNGIGPLSGGYLSNSINLLAPIVQVTSDGGTTWTEAPAASDYIAQVNGHPLPAVDFGAPTSVTVHFQLLTPATNINGIRIVGSEGGQAGNGFLGAFELEVSQLTPEGVVIENVARVGEDIHFDFLSKPLTTHVVKFKLSMDAAWQTLATINGDGTRKFVTDSVTNSEVRIYRVTSE